MVKMSLKDAIKTASIIAIGGPLTTYMVKELYDNPYTRAAHIKRVAMKRSLRYAYLRNRRLRGWYDVRGE